MKDWESIKERFKEAAFHTDQQIGVDDDSVLITTSEWEIEIFPSNTVQVYQRHHNVPHKMTFENADVRYNKAGTVLIDNENYHARYRIR